MVNCITNLHKHFMGCSSTCNYQYIYYYKIVGFVFVSLTPLTNFMLLSSMQLSDTDCVADSSNRYICCYNKDVLWL